MQPFQTALSINGVKSYIIALFFLKNGGRLSYISIIIL